MKQVVIENPVINSPFEEPARHFRFSEDGNSLSPSPLAGEGRGEGEINLIIEVTGENKKDKAAKVSTVRTLWVPAVNKHGGFGRWLFWEITDPWDAMNIIRSYLQNLKNKGL